MLGQVKQYRKSTGSFFIHFSIQYFKKFIQRGYYSVRVNIILNILLAFISKTWTLICTKLSNYIIRVAT